MSETKIISVNPDFKLNDMVEKLIQTYQGKGFSVVANSVGNGVVIDFRKDDDGIKKYVGLAQGINANITPNNNTLTINFTDAEWAGKIVGFIIGWFLCWIPWIPVAIGGYNQMQLPTKIVNDIQMIAGGAVPFGH